MPAVSVIIPSYNRREFLARAVASVLEQDWRDLECVVVDDGSSDGSAEMLQRDFNDSRLRYLRQENLGVSAARNRGVHDSTGAWLAFLDSDDYWQPGKLSRQLEQLHAQPEYPACYTEETWYRRGRWANPKTVHAKHSGWIFEQCLPLCIISPSSIVLRRRVYQELGGFDESLPACEDYDLWLRLSARYPILLLRERLIVKCNGHPGQLSQAHWGLDRFRVRALWKLVADESLPWRLRRPALQTLAEKSGVVAGGARKRGAWERERVFRHSQEEALRWLESSPDAA